MPKRTQNQPKTKLELAEIIIKKLRNEIHRLQSLLIKYNETKETKDEANRRDPKWFGRTY